MRDVSLSAQKFEDFSDERVAPSRRGNAALPPDFGPARQKERPALARFLRTPRLGVMVLVGIAGLALVGVPLNALFLQDGRHPAPLFGGHALAPEPIQTAAKPAPRPAPADVAHVAAEPVKTDSAHARPAKPEARSDAAALADILKSTAPATAPAPAAATARPTKKGEAVASRDAIGALLGPAPKPAPAVKPTSAAKPTLAAKPAAAPRPAAPIATNAATAAAPAGPDQSVVSAQRALQRLGYVVKPDGVMSPELRKTIEKFQRDNGLPATGQLGPQVVKLLSTRSAAQH